MYQTDRGLKCDAVVTGEEKKNLDFPYSSLFIEASSIDDLGSRILSVRLTFNTVDLLFVSERLVVLASSCFCVDGNKGCLHRTWTLPQSGLTADISLFWSQQRSSAFK